MSTETNKIKETNKMKFVKPDDFVTKDNLELARLQLLTSMKKHKPLRLPLAVRRKGGLGIVLSTCLGQWQQCGVSIIKLKKNYFFIFNNISVFLR